MMRMPSKQSIIGIIIVAVTILALLFEIIVALQHPASPPVADGMTAPLFQLDSLSGEKVSLEQLRGRAVVVMFWSGLRWPGRWFVKLKRLPKEFANDQVTVLTISVFRNSKYMTTNATILLPVLYDRDTETTRAYHAYNRPVIYLIDKEGQVHRSWVRYSSALDKELKESINDVLNPDTDMNEPDMN